MYNKYCSGNDNYNFLNEKAGEFESKGIVSHFGFDFYLPFENIFPDIKDYFAIRDLDILRNEIKNIINHPYRCADDIISLYGVNLTGNNLVEDCYNSLKSNVDTFSEYSIAEIIAYRFIFRLPQDRSLYNLNTIKAIQQSVIDSCKKFMVISKSNLFCNSIDFLISNLTIDNTLKDRYKNNFIYSNKKFKKGSITFSRNIYNNFNNIDQNTNNAYYNNKVKM